MRRLLLNVELYDFDSLKKSNERRRMKNSQGGDAHRFSSEEGDHDSTLSPDAVRELL